MTTNKLNRAMEALTRLMAYDRGMELRKLAKRSRAYAKGYRWQIIGRGDLRGRVNMVAPDLKSAGDLMRSFPYK